MKIKINVLMVDDHPIILEIYRSVLVQYDPSLYDIKITSGTDCRTGYNAITNNLGRETFDIAFLDISMPSFEDNKIFSGEDLAFFLRQKMPCCKVVLLTTYTGALKIGGIVKNINPEGLIVKNDLTFDEFRLAFEKVLNGERYYSKMVMNVVLTMVNNLVSLDKYDQQIIHHLSRGVKTKDIPKHVALSLSAIEKRKLQIKDFLKVKGGNDEDIIREAEKLGFL